MPLRGKVIDLTKRFHPCKHVHVSGRRCGTRVHKDILWCPDHSQQECRECSSMMRAFKPPKGWGEDIGSR